MNGPLGWRLLRIEEPDERIRVHDEVRAVAFQQAQPLELADLGRDGLPGGSDQPCQILVSQPQGNQGSSGRLNAVLLAELEQDYSQSLVGPSVAEAGELPLDLDEPSGLETDEVSGDYGERDQNLFEALPRDDAHQDIRAGNGVECPLLLGKEKLAEYLVRLKEMENGLSSFLRYGDELHQPLPHDEHCIGGISLGEDCGSPLVASFRAQTGDTAHVWIGNAFEEFVGGRSNHSF